MSWSPRRMRGRSAIRCLFFFFAAIFSISYFCYELNLFEASLPPEYEQLMALNKNSSSCGCQVPKLDPFDPSIEKYYDKASPLVCKQKQEQLVTKFINGILHFDKEKTAGFQCSLTPFEHNYNVSDFKVRHGTKEAIDFKNGYAVEVSHEFFEVDCYREGKILESKGYSKVFAQILKRTKTREYPNTPSIPIEDSSPERPAVILLGIDSMSRSNFLRQLPKSHKTMMEMGFVDMPSQVKIADNTFGNVVALLSGLRSSWTEEFSLDIPDAWGFGFDDYEMIWRNFSRNGYVTMFAEDRPDIGTFNYKEKLEGFKLTPTDHYMRPFWIEMFWSTLARTSTSFCYDNEKLYKIHLDHLESFIETYSGKRHFSFWWTQDMSHGYLNLIGRMDDDLEAFLRRIQSKLNNTILIVVSDHGLRYGDIVETVIGRMESRMPFLSIRLPDIIKQKYPHLENRLKSHKNHLTTQFDLHMTLNDIAWGKFLENSTQNGEKRHKHGYTLFGPLPENRSCHEAGVPSDFCPCFVEREISPKEATLATKVLLEKINEILEKAPSEERKKGNKKEFTCQRLEIKNVVYAGIRVLPETLVKDAKLDKKAPKKGLEIQYRIMFSAQPPSNAVIAGVVVRDFSANKWFTTNEFERNNKYGNSSSCVIDPGLRKICHCLYKN